jgi:3-oxoacyl-[acyl-carrier protein] reductase/2-deoxy-D-gluconate 3-dehydrogenase
VLGALAAGLWAGNQPGSSRRRLLALVVAYLVAASFATIFWGDPKFSKTGIGGALAVFLLLAQPAYTTGVVYRMVRHREGAAAAFLGAALGVLAAALILIPHAQPGVIFVAAAAVLVIMSTTNFSTTGKTAIVTGVGDRGQLGFAVAEAMRAAGMRVYTATFPEYDLTKEDDVARLIATAVADLGSIDVLVNIAGGLSVIKPLAETTREEWERENMRNGETAFLVSRAALPFLRSSRGSIINFASPAGTRAVANLGAYSAAKAAVVAITRAMAIEEKGNGVRVNAIAPGMIDTEMNRKSVSDPDAVKWVKREEIADVVLYLSSEASRAVTGQTIEVLGEGIL